VPEVADNGFPFDTQDYEVFNFYAGVDLENLSLSVYMKNLADEEYITGTGENFGLAGIRVKPHPRTIGATISYSF
jgi:iron complex outermembrane receptor protein